MSPSLVRRAALALVALLPLAAVAGCGSSGTDLRDPPPGATAPEPTSTTSSTAAPVVFAISSPAFVEGGDLPVDHTCAGAGTAPVLTWTGVPNGTVEIAITATVPHDDIAAPVVHWIVTGLPGTVSGLDPSAPPQGVVEGPNSEGGIGWTPPCPEGGAIERLQFQLHALDEPSAVEAGMTALEAYQHLIAVPGSRALTSASVRLP